MSLEQASAEDTLKVRQRLAGRGRMVFALSLVLGVAASLHVYIGRKLIMQSGLPHPWNVGAWILLACLFASIPLGFAATRLHLGRATRFLGWVSSVWMGFFGLLLPLSAVTDVLLWLLKATGRLSAPEWHAAFELQSYGLALGVPLLVLYGVWVARSGPWVEKVTVLLPHLPQAFNGLRIVQLSDVHIGPTLDGKFLEKVVAQVNALQPDVVALTGDLVDGSVSQLRPHMEALAQLKARHGVYFVTGNHEYYSGGAEWEAEVARLGVTVLHNEHRVLEQGGAKLVVAGITDFEGGRFYADHSSRPDLAFQHAPKDAPRILLAHQPRSAFAAATQRVDLQLSGHTHGGQMFPWMFFVPLQQPSVSGLKNIAGIQVYTHRGTGYWGPPIRLGPKGEIAEVTLRCP